MKYLRKNSDNTIHLIADKEQVDTFPYEGDLPVDFYENFSKGKYLFIEGEIVLNADWNEETESAENADELDEETPHLELLNQAGIFTKAELNAVEDLTTIAGIGTVKAAEIKTYIG